ncbi:TPA_exp: putative MFS peptide transporter [Trichophyton benhamiae CBS 112371]|uniref:MFS peptide transporter, putative n=1 Tax=Arthroderma benhamiae (strain ATCC MYA-4681 / CBS 112371) TaxID=663331 RepID=D4ARI6_ARTBC|nr:MFS peptide transporter, putative [Trichophyton benhamiae CBS 112371]EFE34329.1 MFS peptide transporter, putative [Trichophyton benhamiae CBS 112371]DAA77274.1 TPA_exp: putative MFS peptide transporter [Trichophyton benhamiae CBS 112371]
MTASGGSEADGRDSPKYTSALDEKELSTVQAIAANGAHESDDEATGLRKELPTDEEIATLRRVPDRIPWIAFSIAFVELCERFSYYGTTAVFVNFIQQPLPKGSTAGNSVGPGIITSRVPGALGLGQRASTAISTFNSFWAYIMPLVGAYIAEEHLGRFRTIMYSIACALVGHTILIISAIPPVIKNPNGALPCFVIGLVIMGVGTGGFKSNISPLIAEQYTETQMYIRTEKSGERVIVDPAATVSRIFILFYLMINIGSLCGQIGMVFAEKYVGFYLSFLLPTLMFCLCPLVLFICRKRYVRTKPGGSIYYKAMKLIGLVAKGKGSWNVAKMSRDFKHPDSWNACKPSRLANKPAWMTFDDAWVDEVRRGIIACSVFLWYPLFWVAYNQGTTNLTSQAATLELAGVPNDIINNLNPITLIVFIPIMDRIVYPSLRKSGIRFTPIKRITTGFFLAGCGMVSSAVLQYYIYKTNPCGNEASKCKTEYGKNSPISVWVQAVAYVLGGVSEIFASVTSLEYAFMKAPRNMRSLVQAFALFMNAISSALLQALVGLSADPLLIWNYTVTACLSFIGCIGFWISNRKADQAEDELNQLAVADFHAGDKEGEKAA